MASAILRGGSEGAELVSAADACFAREDVAEENGYWVLRRERPAVLLATLVADA